MKNSVLFIVLLFMLSRCQRGNNVEAPILENSEELIQAKKLAEKYCTNCHVFPEPNLLDRATWGKVLPVMDGEMSKASIPISAFEWIVIQDYYIKSAPISLRSIEEDDDIEEGSTFEEQDLANKTTGIFPYLSLLEYDVAGGSFLAGDMSGNIFLSDGKNFHQKTQLKNIPIDAMVNHDNESLFVLCIGNIIPSGEKNGALIEIDKTGSEHALIDSLDRPVHFSYDDLDNDGTKECLISCFGTTVGPVNTGNLSLYKKTDGGSYAERVIKSMPGATKTIVADFNRDHQPDFIALFSQGQESFSLFLNKGKLEFEEKVLLQFPPVYGFNSFELVDMNGDTWLDIVATNGDNSDYSMVYKNYHGIRIFLNDGKNNFKEKYFLPINGASKVIIRDFDRDGDLDFVTLAMYPNFENRAWETLLYLENQSDLNFTVSFLEEEPSGKWLVMDAGDIDQDGYDDLVVGSNNSIVHPMTIPDELLKTWNKNKKALMVLRNKSGD